MGECHLPRQNIAHEDSAEQDIEEGLERFDDVDERELQRMWITREVSWTAQAVVRGRRLTEPAPSDMTVTH